MNNFQLDLREYLCPMPLLICKKALSGLQAGQKLSIFVNESVSVQDFVLLAQSLNLTFVEKNTHHFYFEKGTTDEK